MPLMVAAALKISRSDRRELERFLRRRRCRIAQDPRPFVWHTPAKQIIAKVRRGRAALTHQIKSATDH